MKNSFFNLLENKLKLKIQKLERKKSPFWPWIFHSIYVFMSILIIKPSYASHLVDLPRLSPGDAQIHLNLNTPGNFSTVNPFSTTFNDRLLSNNIWLWENELVNVLDTPLQVAVLFDASQIGTPNNEPLLFFPTLQPGDTLFVDIAVQDNPPETTIPGGLPGLLYSFLNLTGTVVGYDTAIWESPTVNPNDGIPGLLPGPLGPQVRNADNEFVEFVDPITEEDCQNNPDCDFDNRITIELTQKVPEPSIILGLITISGIALSASEKKQS